MAMEGLNAKDGKRPRKAQMAMEGLNVKDGKRPRKAQMAMEGLNAKDGKRPRKGQLPWKVQTAMERPKSRHECSAVPRYRSTVAWGVGLDPPPFLLSAR
ncbi:hypothetical protein CKO15_02505 [Halorhodospira abdelmalekii]|nr:hypothetical protein [Halorhodospira abdelmalekii]